MDVLVSGIRKWECEAFVELVFEKLKYAGLDYYQIPHMKKAQQLIDSGKSIDLLILSGAPARDFDDKSSEHNTKYFQYARFAQRNSKIPSIMLVDGNSPAIIDSLSNIHPPNWTCYFSEFERVTRKQINAVLQGKNLRWSVF